MSAVFELHGKTTRIYQKITQQLQDKDREQLLTELTTFLDEREELFKQLLPPYTEEEQRLGKEIVKMDQEIQVSLQDRLLQIKGSIKQLQNQKRNNKKYLNPYQNVSSIDGMYFDKKN